MTTKTCFKCGETKDIECFHKHKMMADGHLGKCSACTVKDVAEWRKKQPSGHRHGETAKSSAEAKANKKKQMAIYRKRESDKIKKYNKEYLAAHLPEARIKCVTRRAKLLHAIPSWAEDELDSFLVQEMYRLANLRSKLTGIKWHIDHIVPLNSHVVCGLHCAANLRVIPAFLNMSKNNRYWPNMP